MAAFDEITEARVLDASARWKMFPEAYLLDVLISINLRAALIYLALSGILIASGLCTFVLGLRQSGASLSGGSSLVGDLLKFGGLPLTLASALPINRIVTRLGRCRALRSMEALAVGCLSMGPKDADEVKSVRSRIQDMTEKMSMG